MSLCVVCMLKSSKMKYVIALLYMLSHTNSNCTLSSYHLVMAEEIHVR